MSKILMFAGSARKESFNKKLISVAAKIAEEKGAKVTKIDLKDYPMPIYDGDLEDKDGQPENARKIYDLLKEHDSLIIASPEYNGLPSPLLKNTIDWVSRIDVKIYSQKIAAIMSASIGGLGGMRGLPHLRTLLTNLNVLVIPQQVTISSAMDAFDENDNLKDQKHNSSVESLVDALIKISK
ncbi:NAD(P)H-dependent oxidoreductase [Rickettsiales bacterium]|nr:NAD(P)H-dependent oxidoreductase [Rickettsiales bacterium]